MKPPQASTSMPSSSTFKRHHARRLDAIHHEEGAAVVGDPAQTSGRSARKPVVWRTAATATMRVRWSTCAATRAGSTRRCCVERHDPDLDARAPAGPAMGKVLFQCSSAGTTTLSPGFQAQPGRSQADAHSGAGDQRVFLGPAPQEARTGGASRDSAPADVGWGAWAARSRYSSSLWRTSAFRGDSAALFRKTSAPGHREQSADGEPDPWDVSLEPRPASRRCGCQCPAGWLRSSGAARRVGPMLYYIHSPAASSSDLTFSSFHFARAFFGSSHVLGRHRRRHHRTPGPLPHGGGDRRREPGAGASTSPRGTWIPANPSWRPWSGKPGRRPA